MEVKSKEEIKKIKQYTIKFDEVNSYDEINKDIENGFKLDRISGGTTLITLSLVKYETR